MATQLTTTLPIPAHDDAADPDGRGAVGFAPLGRFGNEEVADAGQAHGAR